MNAQRILVVDDERAICQLCQVELQKVGLQVEWTTSPLEACERIASQSYDLLITDFKMPEMDGLELLRTAQKLRPGLPVIVMTAYASLDVALTALKRGASNFVNKPFHRDELIFAVQNVLEKQRLLQENLRLKSLVNLIQVSDQITTVHDPQKIYSLLMDAVIRETGATRGKVFRFDDRENQLVLACEFTQNGKLNVNYPPQEVAEAILPEEDLSADGDALPETIAIPMQTSNKFLGLISLSRQKPPFAQIDIDIAKVLASQAAIALENSALIREIESLFLETIKSLASTLDEKDPYTHGHSQRVSEIAVEIGRRMELSREQLDTLALAGSLHDIGKIGIPDRVLLKPGPLTREEFEIIKTHPEKGARILSHIHRMQPVIDAVYTHHEWYNGKGYPRGLKGEEIPLLGAIISVADALDTILTDRPYRKRRSLEEAYQILREGSGEQFHPDVVAAVLRGPLQSLREIPVGETEEKVATPE